MLLHAERAFFSIYYLTFFKNRYYSCTSLLLRQTQHSDNDTSLHVHSLQTRLRRRTRTAYGYFLQGCPLQCAYCHNPDTRPLAGGEEIGIRTLLIKLLAINPTTVTPEASPLRWRTIVPSSCVDSVPHALPEPRHPHRHRHRSGSHRWRHGCCPQLICSFLISNTVNQTSIGNSLVVISSISPHFRMGPMAKQKLWVRQVIIPGITDSAEQIQQLGDMLLTFRASNE